MDQLQIVYINLNHRKDRREQMEKELVNIPKENIHRIEAVYYPKNGPLGCCVSHIKAIELAMKNKWDKVLILEDDFIFDNSIDFTNYLLKRFYNTGLNWDVLMFSSNLLRFERTDFNFLNKVLEGKTTSGYLLNSNYYDILLGNFKECFRELNIEVYKKSLKHSCIDMGWRKLQRGGNWYITDPRIGKQKDGFSDIMKQYKNYDC